MLGPLFLPTPSRVKNWKGVSNGTVITVEGFSFLFEYLSSPSSRECYVNALWHCYKNLLLNIGMMKCWRPCIKVNTSWPSSPADGSGENTNISVSTSSLFSPGHRPGWIRMGGGPFHRSPHLRWGEDSDPDWSSEDKCQIFLNPKFYSQLKIYLNDFVNFINPSI